jgi:lysophospholipase L1-like esterase
VQATAEALAPNPITITVGIMVPDGSILPVYFNGRRSVTFDRYAVSDPVTLPRGVAWIQSRTFVSVTAGQKWPTGFPDNLGSVYGTNEGAEKGTSITDKSLSGTIASPGNSGVAAYGPTAIIGRPAGGDWGTLPAIAGIGDSILYGQGDRLLVAAGRGFFERAINNQVGFLNLGAPTETAANFIAAGGGALRRGFLAGMKAVLCEYGGNDIWNGATYAQTRAYLLAAWRLTKSASGGLVFQTTIGPKSASTDGWLTVAGQTTDATNAVRVQVNDWIRDGAPMNVADSTAAATGASGAGIIRAGAAGHPLEDYFEVADTMESARNSGLWKQDPTLRVVTDAAMTSGSDVLTSASAAFVAGDVDEKYARVLGAGAAGVPVLARIRFRTGATTVNLTSSAATTVSATTATIAGRFTADGVHPDVLATRAMAAAIDVDRMVAG